MIELSERVHTDYVDSVGILSARDANKEIIGLNVSVDERFVMNSLHTRNLECLCEYCAEMGNPRTAMM